MSVVTPLILCLYFLCFVPNFLHDVLMRLVLLYFSLGSDNGPDNRSFYRLLVGTAFQYLYDKAGSEPHACGGRGKPVSASTQCAISTSVLECLFVNVITGCMSIVNGKKKQTSW
jgi:hypothetical protein